MNTTFYKKTGNNVQIVFRKTTSEVSYVGIMVGAGTRDEGEQESGLAHYIEHCVFKGARMGEKARGREGEQARELTARDIIEKIEGVGGEINAYTTKEETTYYAATPRKQWKKTLTLLADMVLRPTLPKKETDKEVEVILDEIDSYEDSPSELIYDDFENLIFDQHSLSRPILGTKQSVRRIAKKADIARQFMQRQYLPERTVVFVRGNHKSEQIVAAVEQLLGGEWHATKAAATPRTAPTSYTPGERHYKKHTHQVHVMLGSRAYPIGHPKNLTLYLLNNILGGGSLSSRLNLALREKKGLVYTIESQYTALSDTGYWSVYFAADAKDKDECIRLVKQELKTLRDKPLTAHQLKRALTQLHGQMAISAENQEGNALNMAKLMLYHGFAPTWEEIYGRIAEITPEQLQEVAQEIYDERKISTLIYE